MQTIVYAVLTIPPELVLCLLPLSDIVRTRGEIVRSARIAGKEDKMIRILVQLVPGGNEARTRELDGRSLRTCRRPAARRRIRTTGSMRREGANPLRIFPPGAAARACCPS